MDKIAFIGSFGNKWDEEGIARSFEKIGIKILRFEENFFNPDAFEKSVAREKPDIILFAKLKVMVGKERIFTTGIPTVSWSFDLFRGLPRQTWIKTHAMFKADLVLTPDGGNDVWWRGNGINHKVLRQGLYDEYYYKADREKKYDVVFVGSRLSNLIYRQELSIFLGKHYNFNWVGAENTLECRGHQLNELYAESKIVIGDSVPSPNYWSNRIYEVLGRGGFLISPKVEGLEKEYEYYKHFVPYTNFENLKEKIDYFLVHPEEREKIAQAGFEQTKNYLLTERCKEFLKICECLK